MNFLTIIEEEKSETLLYRSLFQRAALALGGLLIVLLGLQMFVGYILQAKIDKLDDQLLTSGGAYAEIATLEQQVKSLESKLEEVIRRSSGQTSQKPFMILQRLVLIVSGSIS